MKSPENTLIMQYDTGRWELIVADDYRKLRIADYAMNVFGEFIKSRTFEPGTESDEEVLKRSEAFDSWQTLSFLEESKNTKMDKLPLQIVLVEEASTGITLSPSSVDTQIDSLLVSFENASEEVEEDIVPMPEGTSIRDALRRLLTEAEDEEQPGSEEPMSEEETVTSDDEQKTNEPAEPLTPKINIDEFTESVAMLIETYHKRLDIETVIFNRAKNYLQENHGDEAASQFEDIMLEEHDIDLRVKAHEEPGPKHFAVGSGPAV